jgi:hypothetical protein
MKRRLEASQVGLLLFYLGLGFVSSLVWVRIANLAVLPSWHLDMILGRAPAPNQYRPLTPWLAEGLRLALPGQNLFTAYVVLRGITTGLGLFFFDRYMRVWFTRPAAAGGALALAAIIPFTYFRVVQESDPINLLAFVLAYWAMAVERDFLLFPLVLLGTLNRETTALIPALYLVARIGGRPGREVASRTAGLAACWIAVYGGLRLLYGSRGYYCDVVMWSKNIASWGPTIQVLLLFGALWVLALFGARKAPTLLRRSLWLLPPYIALHYVVAMVNEVRLFLPYAPSIIPLAWWALFPEGLLPEEPKRAARRAATRAR